MSALRAVGRLPSGERRWLWISVALAAAATGAAMALLATSGYLITRAAQRPQVLALMVAIVAVRSFGVARAGLRYAERLASHELTLRQLARLRSRFFGGLVPLIPGQLQRQGRGELLARFVGDVDAMADLYLRVVMPVLVALVVIALAAAAGAVMLTAAGIVIAAALALDAGASAWLADRVGRTAASGQAPVRARLSDQLVEAIDGAAELAVAGQATTSAAALARTDGQLATLGRRDAVAAAAAGGAHGLVSGAGLLAVLIVGVGGVRGGALPGVLLAAVVFLYLGAREAIAPLGRAAQRARGCAASAARLEEVCARPAPVTDPVAPRSLPKVGALVAEGISARYGRDEPPVLQDVDLRLGAGERVALLGESGAGKTTLAELLVRFRDPERGRVTLGGVDVREATQKELREEVLLSGQSAHLFNTSLRANLLIARPAATDSDLWEALECVELAPWAAALPDGLDTPVGQYGERVSGGQRQRIGLARALLSGSRFLILDEPTAHLDPEMAARIVPRILRHARTRGVLLITHDPDVAAYCDRAVRLAAGRLQTDLRPSGQTRSVTP